MNTVHRVQNVKYELLRSQLQSTLGHWQNFQNSVAEGTFIQGVSDSSTLPRAVAWLIILLNYIYFFLISNNGQKGFGNQRQKVDINFTSSQANATSIGINLFYQSASNLSTGRAFNTLVVKVVDTITINTESYSITLPIKTQCSGSIPIQLSLSQQALLQTTTTIVSGASIAIVPGGLVLNILMAGCLQYVWGLMDDLSFLMILTMISLTVQGEAQLVQSTMLNFIYFDILQPSIWFIPAMFPNDDGSNNYALNPQFDNAGFNQMIAIKNLGSTIFTLILLFPLVFLLKLAVKKCNIQSRVSHLNSLHSLITYISGNIMWSGTIRFILQQYAPIFLSSMINLYDMTFVTLGDGFSSVLSILCTVGCTIVIVVFGLLIRKYRALGEIESPYFKETYGPLIEGLYTKGVVGCYWTVITLIRWHITITVLVCLREYYSFQLIILLIVSGSFTLLVYLGSL